MFANSQMGGLNLGFPDVCLTPVPPAPAPIPIPYPNLSIGPLGIPFVPVVLYGGTPAHNLATMIPISLGDNPGIATGVASGTVMGPTRSLTAAFSVLVGGLPGTRLTSVNIHNSTNAPGMRIVPSQVRVLLLAP
ncbi:MULTISPECIES: DUF4150 domain-containing protein [Polyangium]|uniref:DUF4150 domain-containing protein n=1 Tax=Polyangium jinanense TaxID=2829994 RepID=A0A9X3X930_9BACT|nr:MULTISPECIES: DUF4150 domain-containing protein [Polyangium]MDC3958880.1 DUF4150 domain-containing protein [Polyangium jinanense]MDC3985994.1 DUF4150 domain-containing protein [Polyangium jinanense]MDI3290147.1 DUF4150 domain-containing protein [Polyangium sp. 15x6]